MGSPRRLMLVALAVAVACGACTRSRVAQLYQKDGVQFMYYSDWKVIKDAPVPGNPAVRAIHVENSDHAVVSLICVPPSSPQTLEEFATAVAEKRGAAIENKLSFGSLKAATVTRGTSQPTTGQIAGQQRPGFLHRFNIEVLNSQVPHEAKFYWLHGSRYTIMIMSQVATAHAAESNPGSELILSTLSIDGAR
jgi:hypothetical protein